MLWGLLMIVTESNCLQPYSKALLLPGGVLYPKVTGLLILIFLGIFLSPS